MGVNMIYNNSAKKNSCSSLINFAKKVFGKKCYRASSLFYDWAFKKNYIKMYTTEIKSGEVTSMIQTISTTINKVPILSFFNYISDEEYKGVGLVHLLRIKNSKSFFVPAVSNQKLSSMYEKFGASKLNFYWFKRYIIPRPSIISFNYYLRNKKIQIYDAHYGINISNILSESQINKICMISGFEDKEYIKWRLSSIDNKRVFFLQDNENGATIIAVLGKRRGFPIIRIIGSNGTSITVKKLIDRACKLGSSLGVLACFVTIPANQSNYLNQDKKFIKRDEINTYMKGHISSEGFLMLCGDLGFEEQFG